MIPFRFSLWTLLAGVALLAMTFAAFASGADIWADTFVTTTVTLWLAAIITTVFGSGSRRAFAGGFVLVALLYALLVLVPPVRDVLGHRLLTTRLVKYAHPRLAKTIAPILEPAVASLALWVRRNGTFWFNGEELTENDVLEMLENTDEQVRDKTAMILYLDPGVSVSSVRPVLNIAQKTGLKTSVMGVTARPTWEEFELLGQCQCALFVGLIGGAMASWIYHTRMKSRLSE